MKINKEVAGVDKLLVIFFYLSFAMTVYAESDSWKRNEAPAKVRSYTYRIVKSYPHDKHAFTQGLVIADGLMYESTGLNGRSSLRRVDLDTGKVVQVHELTSQFFGEGITVLDNKIIQLTWKSRFGFVYDKNSFQLLRVFTYPAEGWGVTHDGRNLITSDGSAHLYFIDPETFDEKRRIRVYDNEGPVTQLNELEYVAGKVYANVWKTDRIAIIDPETGRVTGWIDLSGLLGNKEYSEPVDVLNGIAYDNSRDALYVTGKLWPNLFQIELVETTGK